MPDGKQLTDGNSQGEPHPLMAQVYPLLPDLVYYAFLHFHHFPIPGESEGRCHDIVVYLLAHDCHNLNTYDPDRGELKTWLNTVVRNYVGDYLKHKRSWNSLEETLLEQLLEQPQQERNAITQEQRSAVDRVVAQLSARKQQLYRLLSEGFSSAEIAERMNIKPASVHQRKYELIRLIQAGLKNGGANPVPEIPQRKKKIIEKNEVRFLLEKAIFMVKAPLRFG
jgi:RNA polymerase sigma factor (sigma-70 family)